MSKTKRIDVAKIFRENVRRIIDDRDLSQCQLAADAELTPEYLCKLLAGQAPRPGLDVCQRIAVALKVPLSRLVSPPVCGKFRKSAPVGRNSS